MPKGPHSGFHIRPGSERPRLWLPVAEDPQTESLAQVRAWIAFYRDLLAVEEGLLEQMRQIAAGLPEPQRRAVELSNVEPMVDFLSQLNERHGFWLKRLELLKAK